MRIKFVILYGLKLTCDQGLGIVTLVWQDKDNWALFQVFCLTWHGVITWMDMALWEGGWRTGPLQLIQIQSSPSILKFILLTVLSQCHSWCMTDVLCGQICFITDICNKTKDFFTSDCAYMCTVRHVITVLVANQSLSHTADWISLSTRSRSALLVNSLAEHMHPCY